MLQYHFFIRVAKYGLPTLQQGDITATNVIDPSNTLHISSYTYNFAESTFNLICLIIVGRKLKYKLFKHYGIRIKT